MSHCDISKIAQSGHTVYSFGNTSKNNSALTRMIKAITFKSIGLKLLNCVFIKTNLSEQNGVSERSELTPF